MAGACHENLRTSATGAQHCTGIEGELRAGQRTSGRRDSFRGSNGMNGGSVMKAEYRVRNLLFPQVEDSRLRTRPRCLLGFEGGIWLHRFLHEKQRVRTRKKRRKEVDPIPDPPWDKYPGHAPGCAPEAVPSQKRWSCDEPEAILDYLHGDIPSKEAKACCYYEYARTSQLFRKARSSFLLGLRNKLPRKGRPWRAVVAREAVIAADLGGLLREPMGLEIVSCHRFPDKPWRELTADQRQDICVHFVLPRIIPVVTDSFILKARGFLKNLDSKRSQTRRLGSSEMGGPYAADTRPS